jgi:IstB-like ATP binding protein/Integrase core domain
VENFPVPFRRKFCRKLLNLLCYDLIAIDELGFLPFSQSGGQLLFHLISNLYENTSLLITTNLAFAAHDLIASPAFIVMKAADAFKDKTTAPNQLWQTGFTYLKVIGWGWFYPSTVLDDFSRYIIAWKLCSTMKVEDVTATLDLALKA